MDLSEPLVLPAVPEQPVRVSLPRLAAIAPLASGVVLWVVTGSVIALCFAAMGPLMMLAGAVDAARQRRRDRKRDDAKAQQQWERVEGQLVQRHGAERAERLLRHPNLSAWLTDPPLGETVLDEATPLVLGLGDETSTVRVTGGEGPRADEFRQRARIVTGVPITAALRGGLAVRGPRPAASAVVRALVVQMCLRFRPSQLAIAGDGLGALGLTGLPHARRTSRGRFRVAVTGSAGDRGADAVIALLGPGAELPERISTLIDIDGPDTVSVRTESGVRTLIPDVLSKMQAAALCVQWPGAPDEGGGVPERLLLGDLRPASDTPGLTAMIARGEDGDLCIDLAGDGPHAIVTGITGSGKSELLITWVAAIARVHSPESVNFVLADFKGGTAFDPLAALPHVAAVITDLDGDGARRGVTSLRAEMRRREEALAHARARDISDPAVGLARLVIVVDEFAALLAEHPELGDVFIDIAARGRALGMHLILGTQRAAGVVREALAANCPLRLSLRVADAADSRAVVGVADAAELPGDAPSRGLAIARRPQDSGTHLVRIALTGPDDIAQIAGVWSASPRARSPWLPALASRIPLAEVPTSGSGDSGGIVLGLADEPERQRQEAVCLRSGLDRGFAVFGGPQSGKSSVIALLAAQQPGFLMVGPDAEAAWDAVDALSGAHRPAPLVLIDDLDALIAGFPGEYAHVFAERLERAVRRVTAAGSSVVISASRSSGPIGRIADMLPGRALLALPSRSDHLAVGGTTHSHLPSRPPGRAHFQGREVQFALPPRPLPSSRHAVPLWHPGELTAVVANRPVLFAEALRRRLPSAGILLAEEASAHIAPAGSGPVIVVGDGEAWQRQWTLWQRMRGGADVLIMSECTAELRTLLSVREPPPYARAHAGRAWVMSEGGPLERVVVAEEDVS